MSNVFREVRREITVHELTKLSKRLNSWLSERGQKDVDENHQYIGLHKTRLAVLNTVLLGAVRTLQTQLNDLKISAISDTGALYEQLREYDRAIVWLQRVWEYFAAKFSQRDDPQELGPFLKAADELVWSCYRQVWMRLEVRLQKKQGPAPLAYVASEYSPAAWQADKPAPLELRPTAEVEGLREWVQNLPVPILMLPPWCVDSPWWLVFVAHEVGHHLLHDMGILADLQKRMGDVASSHNLKPGEVDRWKLWTEEIFADCFSVMMLGDWALRGLREIEWSGPAAMMRARTLYPPPAVRLDLLATIAETLGLGGRKALGELDLEGCRHQSTQAERDFSMVPDVVNLLREPLSPALGKLEKLCSVDELAGKIAAGEIDLWAEKLRKDPGVPEKELIQPRLVLMGALCAWDKIIAETAGSPHLRPAQLDTLAANTKLALRSSGPQDERAGAVEDESLATIGTELAGLLLQASREHPPRAASAGGAHAVQD